ncbi:MAG TPA: ATP-binding protein [Burkholderiales bacterium]|nr:ATP-binding protein [Burkholderiales bacterium]
MSSDLERLVNRIEKVLAQLEDILPRVHPAPDWKGGLAYRWRKRTNAGFLQPVGHPHRIRLADLQGIHNQIRLIEQNTRQFMEGLPANNVLLTGARGTGKSSLVKALLNKFSPKGLRLIEVDKQDLMDLPDIVDLIADVPFKFILFCDDLSFDADEPGYKALKVVLDGSISAASENLLIYATSNRRHLMPEFMQENLETKYIGEEIHPGETVEEKVSLSERFGLWVSFYPFDQNEYLAIVDYWLGELGVPERGRGTKARDEALQWALTRGSRSGRVAWHFARDWAGRHGITSGASRKKA